MAEIVKFLLSNPFFAAFLQFIHLLSAAAIFGGLLFFRLVYIPYADTQGDKFTDARKFARRRSRRWLWFMLFILLLTGVGLWIIQAPIADTKAHLLLTVKSALWLGITVLLLLQTLPTKKLSMAKRQVPFYATVVVLLAVLCFMISSFLQAHLRQLFEVWMQSELL